MKIPLGDFEDRYTASFQDYLTTPGEAPLERAYELGRMAVAGGLGVLEMSALHHRALKGAFRAAHTPEEVRRILQLGEIFFVESLAPFEMIHRGFRDANAALRRLNERLEQEARRIAHALHDEAGQLVASAHIALAEIGRESPPRSRERLQEVRLLLDMIEERLRNLSHELRPTILDDLGLVPALEFLADRVSKRTGLAITVQSTVDGRLPAVVETALYRVHQEALNNAGKHAKATRASLEIGRDSKEIRCSIRDDGIGFDAPGIMNNPGGRGLGLIGMRERVEALGGALEIISSPGHGTELAITIPLEG